MKGLVGALEKGPVKAHMDTDFVEVAEGMDDEEDGSVEV